MTKSQEALPSDRIRQSILLIRGQRVMLDVDLALVYGVTTKRLNEQVTRNQDRFPADFMFRLTRQEKTEVVANCDHLQGLKFSKAPPRAFTEHGAIMLAAVLSSPVAIHASVQIVRAFVQLREMLSGHRDLADKLAVLERRYDHQFKVVFDAIRELMIQGACSEEGDRLQGVGSPVGGERLGIAPGAKRQVRRGSKRTKRPHSQVAAGPSLTKLASLPCTICEPFGSRCVAPHETHERVPLAWPTGVLAPRLGFRFDARLDRRGCLPLKNKWGMQWSKIPLSLFSVPRFRERFDALSRS